MNGVLAGIAVANLLVTAYVLPSLWKRVVTGSHKAALVPMTGLILMFGAAIAAVLLINAGATLLYWRSKR